MTQQGYIKLHRQILEWQWYKNIPVRVLFEHCLLRANHKDNNWQGIVIKKGSFVTSYENLSIETGLSFQQVRTALKKLKLTNELTIKTTTKYSIISIQNWEEYQIDNIQINKQITNNQQTNNKQITTNNNDNNEKNEKKLFTPPTINEIETYCKERNNNVNAKQFYDYYSVANWLDSKGNRIKNWKQKIIAVWEKKQNNNISDIVRSVLNEQE